MKRWIVLLFILILVPYLLLSFAAHPAADDYSYAVVLDQQGFWATQGFFYQTWTGRYLATAMISLGKYMIEWPILYQLVPALLLMLTGLASYRLMRQNTTGLLEPNEQVIASLGFMAILLANFPSTSQGFYWLAGSVTYTLPLMLATICATILVPCFRTHQNFSGQQTIALVIAAFIIIGCNETIMLLWMYTISALIFWDLLHCKKTFARRVLVFALSAGFSALVVLAPGNSFRTEHFEDSHRLFFSVYRSIIEIVSHGFEFISIPLLAGTVLLLWLVVKRGHASLSVSRSDFRWTLIFFLGVMFCGFFPALWSMGKKPPDRVDNIIYVLFTWFWFLLVYQWGSLNRTKVANLLGGKGWLDPGAAVSVFTIGLLVGKNTDHSYYDLLFKASAHNAAFDHRYQLYAEGKGKELLIPAIEPLLSIIEFDDVTPDPDHWVNRSSADYYQLKTLRATE